MTTLPGNCAFLFPGQGSSVAGVEPLVAEHCGELAEHCRAAVGEPDLFERAGESTRFAQPAIFLASLAGWRSLAGPGPTPPRALALAGHSLGELSALAAAGVLDDHDALDLVILRGELMARAAEQVKDGGMLAVLKATVEQAQELADAHEVTLANDNAPGQIVLSGRAGRLAEAAASARAMRVRAIALDVAGAFHSPDMAPAGPEFASALSQVEIRETPTTVISGFSAQPFVDVRAELAAALTHPVRWREVMATLAGRGAEAFVDVGPDEVLAKLVARNLPDRQGIAIGELRDVPA